MTFPPAYPHKSVERIADDIYMVRGSIRMNPLVRITRNMAIIVQGGEITLVNPIRLNEKGLSQLDALGKVKNVVRLGEFHGVDDPFYMDRYAAKFWCQEGGGSHSEPPIDHALTESGALPIAGAQLFCFKNSNFHESALLLESGKGVLLTCDAIQNYADFSNSSLIAKLLLPFLGFKKTTLIGPIWLKGATPDDGSLRSEFDRLLELEFDSLLSAHGTLLKTGAHAAVAKAIETAFKS